MAPLHTTCTYAIVDKRSEECIMIGTTRLTLKERWGHYSKPSAATRTDNQIYSYMHAEGIDNFELRPVLEFEYDEFGGEKGAQDAGFDGEKWLVALIQKSGYETYNITVGGRGRTLYTSDDPRSMIQRKKAILDVCQRRAEARQALNARYECLAARRRYRAYIAPCKNSGWVELAYAIWGGYKVS
jgi:hypothetical protein